MFKIDRQKWLAAVEAAKGNAEELTKLYSIRAMARGRVHRKAAGLTHYQYRQLRGYQVEAPSYAEFTAANGTLTIALDAADQEKYVGLAWQAFEKAEVVSVSAAQPLMLG